MINNEQAKAMVKDFREKIGQDEKNKVIEFCNTTVNDSIKKEAINGIGFTYIEVPQGIEFYMVLNHIQAQGFKAYETGVRRIWIQW